MSHEYRGVGNRPFVPQPSGRGSPEQTMLKSPLLKITLIAAQGLGFGYGKLMGGSWSLLTDRPIPWWVMWAGHRAQVSSVTSPESSHLEGGKWLTSSDNQQSDRSEALALGNWEIPWQRVRDTNCAWR